MQDGLKKLSAKTAITILMKRIDSPDNMEALMTHETDIPMDQNFLSSPTTIDLIKSIMVKD